MMSVLWAVKWRDVLCEYLPALTNRKEKTSMIEEIEVAILSLGKTNQVNPRAVWKIALTYSDLPHPTYRVT